MTRPLRAPTAAVIGVLAIGLALIGCDAATPSPGAATQTPGATPSLAPDPSAAMLPSPSVILVEQPLPPGRYVKVPFGPGGMDLCYGQAGCTEDPADDTMRFILTVPDGWVGGTVHTVYLAAGKAPPNGAGLVISRGGGLYAEPCGDEPPPNILVGPTVKDFVDALVAHPKLDVTAPVDVTLAGYPGTYLDLQVPDDISACSASYFPWEPGIYAQGPGSRWHLWILDVDGIRVVVQATDYVGTAGDARAELRAIVDSIEIEP